MSIKTTNLNKSSSTNSNTANYFEIITLLFISSILVIDFFPQFGSVEIIGPQYLYLSVINSITSIFIFKNPELLDNNLKAIFQKSWVFKSYFLFLFLCGFSTVMANNSSLSVVSLVQISIVFCTFINLTLLLHNRLHLIFTVCFVIAISVFIQSYLAISSLVTEAKASSLSAAFSLIQGNTGNINIFAASLTGKIPFLLLGIFHFSKWKKVFLSVSLTLATFIILLISARASYIALLIIVIGFLGTFFFVKNKNKKYISFLPYVVIPLILALFIANLTFKKAEDKGRFSSITNRVNQINPIDSKDGSINIRLKYWDNAFQIAKSNPLFGVGLGNWKIESQPYEKEIVDNLTVSDHPHNDFLEIAAETGFGNLLVYLFLFIFALLANIKKVYASNDEQTRLIALLALLLTIGYGIDAFFNFPLYRPTMQINFCLFLVLTVINVPNSLSSGTFSNKILLFICVISLITVYFSYQTFKAYQFENDTTFDLQLSQPTYRYDKIVDLIPSFPNTATNSQPYIEVAAIYAFKELKFEKALKYFNQSQKINPYTGRAEWYKYQIFKERGILDSARYYAHKAFEIRPRNQDYYLSALVVDANIKETAAILKTHHKFIKYGQDPSTWINTSSALAQSNYPNDKILKFIATGLVIFPNDSTLQNRQKSFQKDAQLAQQNKIQNNANTNTSNIVLATQYATNLQFDKALPYFKKAAVDDPTNIIITQNIGICYFQTKQFKTAINYLEKSLNLPQLADGKTEFLLGAAYFNTNNKNKACNYLIIAENKNYPGAAQLVAQYCK